VNRERLLPALIVATALGIGLLVLQRWVAETKTGAIILVSVWFALVGIAVLIVSSRRHELRAPVLGTFAVILVATVAIGYWTGFRDSEVDEDIVIATAEASGAEREAALAGNAGAAASQGSKDEKPEPEKPAGPVSLATGQFTGEDGHAGSGTATVVKEPSGERTLTFTDFEVDPGAQVEVWLAQDSSSFDDRVELGGLKGNVGNQQYELPSETDLTRYDTVVLYCTPFTVRIAVASLS
jgi:Electron transfer DM13